MVLKTRPTKRKNEWLNLLNVKEIRFKLAFSKCTDLHKWHFLGWEIRQVSTVHDTAQLILLFPGVKGNILRSFPVSDSVRKLRIVLPCYAKSQSLQRNPSIQTIAYSYTRATADFSHSNSFCSSIILSIDENIETISDLNGNMQPYLLPATVTCDSGSNSLSKT